MNIMDLLQLTFDQFPDIPAVTVGVQHLSYGELVAQIDRTAGVLAGHGIGAGDVVAVVDTNSPAQIAVFGACARLGAAFAPINYRVRADELAYMLQDSGAKLVLCGARYEGLVAAAMAEAAGARAALTLDPEAQRFPAFPAALAAAAPWQGENVGQEEDVCALMYTSGTSGRPKGVLLRHQHLVTVALGSGEMASAIGDGAVLVSAPAYHVAGFTALLNNLFLGRRLVLLRQFEPEAWLAAVAEEGVSHAFLVPTMMRQILDSPAFAATDLGSLRVVSYGAAPMPLSLIRRAVQQFPPYVGFVQAFGQTETTGTITVLGPDDHRHDDADAQRQGRAPRLASVGRPLPGVELAVVGADGSPLPPGTVGEILVRSERTMKGYHSRAGQAASTLKDGWHNTGDLGWLDEDGYLFLSGRKSDLIIRGGENISPEEVEGVLASHPAVAEVAVFGVADDYWGEEPHAAVVLAAGQTLGEADLVEYCRERLASFKRPRRVYFVGELPKNHLGKVLRRQLKAQFAAGGSG